MKILIIGKNGQLGSRLETALTDVADVTALGRMELDLKDGKAIHKIINNLCPDIIFNAAAYTAVDDAESDRENAWQINAKALHYIGQAAVDNGARVVHFSTDYVFDGALMRPYKETDLTSPVNFYGASKLAGENALLSSGAHAIIFRISWIYAETGHNFLRTIMRFAEEQQHLDIVADQIGAPTSTACVAEAMTEFVKQAGEFTRASLGFKPPVFHLTCQGQVSWYDFASAIIARIRSSDDQPKLHSISAITSESYPTPAPRPKNSCLDSTRCWEHFGIKLPQWQDALDTVMTSIEKKA